MIVDALLSAGLLIASVAGIFWGAKFGLSLAHSRAPSREDLSRKDWTAVGGGAALAAAVLLTGPISGGSIGTLPLQGIAVLALLLVGAIAIAKKFSGW